MAKLDVVIPAGGYVDAHMAGVVGTRSKPMIRFDGVPIIHRAIHALRESERVGRIVVVGTAEVIASSEAKQAEIVLPEQGSAPKNISLAINELEASGGHPDRVLILAADLCFVTPEGIQRFVDACGERDVYAPLIERSEWEDAYPTCDATFVKLTDGQWTLGGLYNIRVATLKKAITVIEGAFQHRKSKFGLARLLGIRFVYGYLMKKLSVADVVKRAEEVIGASIVPLPASPAELAFDIDALEDYHYALQNFRNCTMGRWAPPPTTGTARN